MSLSIRSQTNFEPNRWGIVLNIVFQVFYIITAVISILLALKMITGVGKIMRQETFFLSTLNHLIHQREILSSYTIIIYISCRSLFINWAYYAYRNVQFFHPDEHTFGTMKMALGFIIPLANFYWPIKVVNKIYRASDPKIKTMEQLKAQKVSKMIIAWWVFTLCWIALSIWNNIAKVMTQSLSTTKLMYQFTIVGDVMGIIVMLWTIAIVLVIQKRQYAKLSLWGT